MSATFVTLTQEDLFKSGGSATSLISIPQVDSIVGKSGLAIYNTVTMQLNETIQYFLTFDDVIKFIHFGKGLGSIAAEGILYSDCDGNLPGMGKLKGAISGLRGKEQEVTIGPITVTAIMTSVQLSITSEPDTMAPFVFNFSIVNHHL
jgi:hypothetical protein